MKRSSTLFTFLFFLLFHTIMFGQQLDHIQGSIIIKARNGIEASHLSTQLNNIITSSYEIRSICIEPFPIWLLQSDAAIENEYELLDKIRLLSEVEIAQFNHFIKDRLIPNDPQFPSQWQYINTGATGGNADADFDAELAWDITIGGLTDAGDTIVVCVIDEGLDASHEDLAQNLWFNYNEIPNNDFDDDGNGYIDDYKGWNSANESDQLDSGPNAGWHGSPVAGIIGARGNNAIGVTGVNWAVKIMTVVRGATEAQTLAAYAYPYTFRKKYNESNGAEGAFVVATNSSWGIDFGQPDDAPIWCAFYDSLGTAGILNAAATVNGDFDVDQVGDLPTACPSDYLISVTNMNFNDQKHTNAGYGATTIDLGSYGTYVWTTKKNNSYGSFTGTSAAAPSVAGAIALLYAAPCPDISWFAKNNPAATAKIIKSYVMDGTTANSSLAGKTVSGGRLNLKGALDQLMNACAYTDCFPPSQITTTNILNNSVNISWLDAVNNNSVTIRYRLIGTTIWTAVLNVGTTFILDNLIPCSTYEYQLKSHCDNADSEFTESLHFVTDGCCEAPGIFETELITGSSVLISWPSSSAAEIYTVRYRADGGLTWTEINTVLPQINLGNLLACTSYELQVQTHCYNGTITSFSESYWWHTSACDNCLEFSYCPVSVSPDALTWISRVQLNDLDNSSGTSLNGYSDFTGNSATLISGFFYSLLIETDFDFVEIGLYFQVWIDLDQDGVFDNEELLLDSTIPSNSCVANINIPMSALSGTTRMRVAARSELFAPCGESGGTGEVEDYCISIAENSECLPPQGINGVQGVDQITISWIGNVWSDLYILRYRELNTMDWVYVNTTIHLISLEDLSPCTDYEYQIQAECNGENSAFSAPKYFTTLGCGGCLDLNYCLPEEGITSFEWISRFSLQEIDYNSGAEGYGDFSGTVAYLTKGMVYDLEIEPTFSGTEYEEFYSVWIDYNQDGSFDDLSEKVFQTLVATTDSLITGSFSIPVFALEGSTRLRVSMKYYAPIENGCEGGFFGEVEDYCVNILGNNSSLCNTPQGIIPVAIDDTSAYIVWNEINDAVSYQFRYRPLSINNGGWIVSTNQHPFFQGSNLLACSEYEYQVRTICESGLSFYSESDYFSTGCFATATSLDYSSDNFIVFPNPFNDYLHVQIPASPEKYWQFMLYNSAGQLIKSLDRILASTELLRLKTNDLPSGLYLIKMTDGKSSKIVKVVK